MADLKKRYTKTRILNILLENEEFSINVPYVMVIDRQGPKVRLEYDPDMIGIASLISEISQHHQIVDLSVTEPELEPVIRQIYEKSQYEELLTH